MTTTVLQVIPSLGAGGAEQGCIDVAAAIVQSGGRAIVASNGGSRAHEITRAGGLHVDLPMHSKNPVTMLKNISRLRNIIKENQVDIVHARSRAPAWSAYKAAKQEGCKFVTTCHAPYNAQNSIKNAYNSIMSKGDIVIAISDYVAQDVIKHHNIDKSKIRVIPRGIALERFHPTAVTPARMVDLTQAWRVPDGANIVLLPGRLTRWKGHKVLIDAVFKLGKHDVFAVITGCDQGRSKYTAELEQLISQKDLAGSVRIVGHCADMPAAYALASVVVCPSIEPEGFGRVPVEASAMGKPTIAANHGGARETIIPNVTGWLTAVGDSDELAEALKHVLSLTQHERAVLGTKAMSHVAQNFTRETMTAQTLAVYSELCGKK